MHTHAYDVSVQFGAEIWATAKAEKKIKKAIGFVSLSRSNDISYLTALGVMGFRTEETGQTACHSQGAEVYPFIGSIQGPNVMEILSKHC